MAKLKVFRTSIGFHDAYVAVPSRAAALRAWGADTDLFAMGAAELVTDAKLTAAPLAKPGEVIRASKGSQLDHLDALLASERPKNGKPEGPAAERRRSARAAPRPSRKKLDDAEAALEVANQAQQSNLMAMDAEIERLRGRRDALDKTYAPTKRKLEAKVEAAQASYDNTLNEWRKATN